MDEKLFKQDAKQIVDMCFDNRLFKDTLTRDDFNSFEDLIQFLLQSKFNTYVKTEELFRKINAKNQ